MPFFNTGTSFTVPSTPGVTEDLVYSQYTQNQWTETLVRFASNLYFDSGNPIINLPDTKQKIAEAKLNVFRSATQGQGGFNVDTDEPDDTAVVWGDEGLDKMNFTNYDPLIALYPSNTSIRTNPTNIKPIVGGSGYFANNALSGSFSYPGGGTVSVPYHPNNGSVWGDTGTTVHGVQEPKEAQGAGRTGGRLVSYLVEAILIYETTTMGTTAYNNAVTRINYVKAFLNTQVGLTHMSATHTTGGTPVWIPGYLQSLGTALGVGIRTSQWFTIFLWLRPFLSTSEETIILQWLKDWAKFHIDNMLVMYNASEFTGLLASDYDSDTKILNKFNNISDQLDNQPALYEPYQGFRNAGFGANAFQLFRLTNRELVGVAWAGELGYWLKKYKPTDTDADYLWQGAALRYKLEFLFQMHPYTLNGENSLARIEYQRENDDDINSNFIFNASHYTSFVLHDLTSIAEAEKKYVGTTTLFDYETRAGQDYTDGSTIMRTTCTGAELSKSLLIYTKEFIKLLQNDEGSVEINISGSLTGRIISDQDYTNNKFRRYALTAIAKMNSHFKDSTLSSAYNGNLSKLAYPSASTLASAAVFSMTLGPMGREPLIIPAWFAQENIVNP